MGESERRRRTAQVVEGGGKHFVRRHVRGGSRLEEESWRGRTGRDIMRMCGAHRFISSACVVLFIIERERAQSEGGRAVFLGADMHIMRAAHLNIGANDDDRGIHQNRLARRRFGVVSSSPSWMYLPKQGVRARDRRFSVDARLSVVGVILPNPLRNRPHVTSWGNVFPARNTKPSRGSR